jgi:hypothetical protein
MGGLVGLVSKLGGAILYVFIGESAFNDNQNARATRVTAGSIPIGLLVGSVFYKTGLLVNIFDSSLWVSLLTGVLISFFFFAGLGVMHSHVNNDE